MNLVGIASANYWQRIDRNAFLKQLYWISFASESAVEDVRRFCVDHPRIAARMVRAWHQPAPQLEQRRRREIDKQLLPKRRQREPRLALPNGLHTQSEAAAKFGCSVKTLRGYVAAGRLRYVQIGHGTKRLRRMFTDADLDEFIANQTRKDSLVCPSSSTRARPSTNMTSGGEVIAFSVLQNKPTGGRRKR
jgi:hypothetical protein